MKLDYDFKQYDLRLLFLMIILNTVGIFIVRSAISAESFKDPLVVRQILGSFVGLSMCIGISLFDYRKLCKFSPYIYAASILACRCPYLWNRFRPWSYAVDNRACSR